jgi:hypothetical protein
VEQSLNLVDHSGDRHRCRRAAAARSETLGEPWFVAQPADRSGKPGRLSGAMEEAIRAAYEEFTRAA